MLENLFNSPFLTSLALTLLHFLWQGLLVATVLKSALLIFNNNKPQLRYALSALAMLVNLLLPIITFVIIYRGEVSSVNTIVNSLALNELIQELKQPDALFSYKELTELLPVLLPYLSILWLSAITLLAGKLLLEISAVNRLPQHGALAPNDKLQTRFNELAKQIQLKITPRLLISLKVEVPMAIGWLKPVVLIPATMISGLNSAQLEMLILHELAHIRRHDYLVNFLQTLVEILLFFHPAVLWVAKQMRNEREYCSDDIAVQHCGDAIAYAHTLADTASLCTKAHHHTIPDMAMAASGGDLKQRVIRLVDHHCAPKNNISKWFASATIIFSVLLLSSKQLLTMPLLDIWYNENPWKQSNHDAKVADKSNDNATAFNSANAYNNEYPNTSIAQQLLIPTTLTPQKSTQQKQHVVAGNIQSLKSTNVAPVTEMSPVGEVFQNSQHALERQQTIINDESHFNATLDSLSSKAAVQPTNIIESSIASDSLMVDSAFERSNSHNPYQQELAQLTTPQNIEKSFAAMPANEDKTNQLNERKGSPLPLKNISVNEPKTIEVTSNNSASIIFIPEVEKTPVTPVWQNAELLTSVDPIYPSIAKRKGIELEVKVDFTIDVDGQIKDIQFDRQSKINYFKNAIRSAIKKWRFLPAKVDDQPVESQMSKVFAFSLQS